MTAAARRGRVFRRADKLYRGRRWARSTISAAPALDGLLFEGTTIVAGASAWAAFPKS
jgi:hypothetical protein